MRSPSERPNNPLAGLPTRFCGSGSQPRKHAVLRRSRITAAVEKDAAFAKDLEGTVMTDSEMENVTAAGGLRQSHNGVRGPRQPRQADGVAVACERCRYLPPFVKQDRALLLTTHQLANIELQSNCRAGGWLGVFRLHHRPGAASIQRSATGLRRRRYRPTRSHRGREKSYYGCGGALTAQSWLREIPVGKVSSSGHRRLG
jgi:hypothetical protein